MSVKAERRAAPRPGRDTRHRAREAALQMLYQWEVGRTALADVLRTFWQHDADTAVAADDLKAFATRLTTGVTEAVRDLDPIIAESAEHWRLERMNVIDRLILRLAVYEFLHERETPVRVVINEALELARTFSGEDSVRFINGLLDAICRRLQRA